MTTISHKQKILLNVTQLKQKKKQRAKNAMQLEVMYTYIHTYFGARTINVLIVLI